jgi:hypothetical protein
MVLTKCPSVGYVALLFRIWGSRVQIWARRPTILTGFSVFLSPSRQMLGWYYKFGHSRIFSHNFQFAAHWSLHYSTPHNLNYPQCRSICPANHYYSFSNDLYLPRLGISSRHLPLKIAAHAKQGSAHHWKISKVHTGPRFAHSFQPSICIRLYNKIVQATSRSRIESWEWTCSQYRTKRSKTWKIWEA